MVDGRKEWTVEGWWYFIVLCNGVVSICAINSTINEPKRGHRSRWVKLLSITNDST